MKKTMLPILLLGFIACSTPEQKTGQSTTEATKRYQFDSVINGKKTALYWLTNDSIKNWDY